MPGLGFLHCTVLVVIDNHPFDPPARRRAIPIVGRLRSRLAPAAIQQGLGRGDPRPGRRVGILHDFGQHGDRVLAVLARQLPDVFWKICFIRHHWEKVAGRMG
jgi:hypothetical protein